MHAESHLRGVVHASHAVRGRRHERRSGDDAGQSRDPARARDGLERLALELLLLLRALDVHDRRLTGHRDGFFHRADAHVAVHRRREVGGQHHLVATERLEATEREGHGVLAGPQIHDAIQPRAVGDGGAHLVDQCRARGFDGHTREHPTGRVAHNAGDAAAGVLRESAIWGADENYGDKPRRDSDTLHGTPMRFEAVSPGYRPGSLPSRHCSGRMR